MDKKPNRFELVLGLAVVATLATGLIGLVMAAIASFNSDWTGAGLSLVAAALAFGLLTNAVLRR